MINDLITSLSSRTGYPVYLEADAYNTQNIHISLKYANVLLNGGKQGELQFKAFISGKGVGIPFIEDLFIAERKILSVLCTNLGEYEVTSPTYTDITGDTLCDYAYFCMFEADNGEMLKNEEEREGYVYNREFRINVYYKEK